jgi:hypothetical protein
MFSNMEQLAALLERHCYTAAETEVNGWKVSLAVYEVLRSRIC